MGNGQPLNTNAQGTTTDNRNKPGRAGSPLPAARPNAFYGAHGVTRPTNATGKWNNFQIRMTNVPASLLVRASTLRSGATAEDGSGFFRHYGLGISHSAQRHGLVIRHFPCISLLRTSARIAALVCSEVMLELLMTLAPSPIINGAVARWLSRWSRAARFS